MALQLQWARLSAYLVARLNETSTWGGLIFFLSGLGVIVKPEWQETIVGFGLALAGALRALLPNDFGGGDR